MRSWWQGSSVTEITWRLVAAQSCGKDLWCSIMAAVGARADWPAEVSAEDFLQVFQVLVRTHARPQVPPVTCWPPLRAMSGTQKMPSSAKLSRPCLVMQCRTACRHMSCCAWICQRSRRCWRLQHLLACWMPRALGGLEQHCGRAPPPPFACLQHSHGLCYLPAAAGAYVHRLQSDFE